MKPKLINAAMFAATMIVVAASAYMLGAGEEVAPSRSASTGPPAPRVQPVQEPTKAAVPPPCVPGAKEVSRSLRSLQSRLKVGLNVDRYTDRVGDTQVSYDDQNTSPGPCDEALERFASAITLHADAASEWEACIDAYPNCFVDDAGLPKSETKGSSIRIFRLYKYWDRAEREARRGDDALSRLTSPGTPASPE